jgi:hypothetical protein
MGIKSYQKALFGVSYPYRQYLRIGGSGTKPIKNKGLKKNGLVIG